VRSVIGKFYRLFPHRMGERISNPNAQSEVCVYGLQAVIIILQRQQQ